MHLEAKRRQLNRRMAELDALINAEAATVPLTIEQFKLAAIRGEVHNAERHREEVLRIQGSIMDNIYARTCLMREAGYI